jgi:hypothetical protein
LLEGKRGMKIVIYNYFNSFVNFEIFILPIIFSLFIFFIIYFHHKNISIWKFKKSGIPSFALIFLLIPINDYIITVFPNISKTKSECRYLYDLGQFEIVSGEFSNLKYNNRSLEMNIDNKLYQFKTIYGYKLNSSQIDEILELKHIVITHINGFLINIEYDTSLD